MTCNTYNNNTGIHKCLLRGGGYMIKVNGYCTGKNINCFNASHLTFSLSKYANMFVLGGGTKNVPGLYGAGVCRQNVLHLSDNKYLVPKGDLLYRDI